MNKMKKNKSEMRWIKKASEESKSKLLNSLPNNNKHNKKAIPNHNKKLLTINRPKIKATQINQNKPINKRSKISYLQLSKSSKMSKI